MNRIFLFIGLFLSLISSSEILSSKPKNPVNVIILFVDDMGYGDIAAHGNPIIKTPNFDSLHDQCARFTNFAVSPTCAPTRAALLTGKHEFLSSVTHTIKPMRNMNPKSTTIANLFQKKGYKTGIFGKWHLGQSEKYGPWFRGFDETLTVPGDNQRSHFDPTLLKNRVATKFKGYRTDILFDEAMKFITDQKDTSFFCYLATYSPHSPHNVPKMYSDPYEAYRNPEKPNEKFNPDFNGQIANVDENLGRLRAHLKSLGLDNNTLLIVLNDNGGTSGVDTFNDGRRGTKGTIWSGGTRAYSFWKLGERFSAGVRKQMSGHVDILPTLADLCDLEIPANLHEQLEGNSLRSVLENAKATLDENRMQVHHVGRWDIPENWADHKYAYCSVRWKQYTLVRIEPCNDKNCKTCFRALNRPIGKYKLMYSNNIEHFPLTTPGQWELFDIEADPFQETNIAAKKPDIVKKMSDFYDVWWEKVKVELTARWGEN
ncbi:MAG: sulfatase-like hydrolase/transferase [Bacteroidota bacterium]